jgi:hypothetical protein
MEVTFGPRNAPLLSLKTTCGADVALPPSHEAEKLNACRHVVIQPHHVAQLNTPSQLGRLVRSILTLESTLRYGSQRCTCTAQIPCI